MKNIAIRKIQCKTALSSSQLPGLVYSLNPYKGCQHQCIYCYVPNVLRIKRDQWGSFVDIKMNIPFVLSKELKIKKPGVVGISTVTDPYQPVEKKYLLTRYCLEQLLKFNFPVSIQTKSSLITRDIDIISKFSHAEILFSIATLDDTHRQLLEPHADPIEKRLSALKECSQANITTNVFFGPIYPTIKLKNIPTLLDNLIESGASKIWIDSLNLKPGILENIMKTIKHNKEMYTAFSKNNLLKDKHYYQLFRKEVLKIAKEKNIKIVDAF
jgi:DNA repair photolyase